jgi:hypothetical protein
MFDAYGMEHVDGGLYNIPWLEYEAYVYSPAFAQIIYPLTLLPWEVFAALWTGLAIGILFWMRVPWMLAFPGVVDDILRGNIHVFLAGAHPGINRADDTCRKHELDVGLIRIRADRELERGDALGLDREAGCPRAHARTFDATASNTSPEPFP